MGFQERNRCQQPPKPLAGLGCWGKATKGASPGSPLLVKNLSCDWVDLELLSRRMDTYPANLSSAVSLTSGFSNPHSQTWDISLGGRLETGEKEIVRAGTRKRSETQRAMGSHEAAKSRELSRWTACAAPGWGLSRFSSCSAPNWPCVQEKHFPPFSCLSNGDDAVPAPASWDFSEDER